MTDEIHVQVRDKIKVAIEAAGHKTYNWRSGMSMHADWNRTDVRIVEISFMYKCPCGRPDMQFYSRQMVTEEFLNVYRDPAEFIAWSVEREALHEIEKHLSGEDDH